MNTDEKRLWQLVKSHLPGTAERIENVVGAGVPDVSAAAAGRDYWVELKVCRTKKAKSPDELCEPLQLRWHTRRRQHGSSVFVLIRTGDLLQLWHHIEDDYVLVWAGSKPYKWELFKTTIIMLLGR